jgi:integrase
MTRLTQFRFTTRSLEQLPACPRDSVSKAIEFSDSDIPGFKIAISKSNRRTFMLRYSFQERKRSMRIGEFPATSLADARKIALEMRGLLDRGIDPQETRDRERGTPTLAAFADTYMVASKLHKRSWRDDASKLQMFILPALGSKRLCDIHRRDIEAFIGDIRPTHTPATCNRYLCLLSAIMKRAMIHEHIDKNPCTGIQRMKENGQTQRFLSPMELGKLFVEFQNVPPEARIAVAALQFLILTGCRLRECLHSRWEHFDADNQVLFVPNSKSGRSKYLQLNDSVLQILAGLDTRGTSEWIFANRRDPTKPINDLRKIFSKCLRAAGINDHVRLHDCRHTFCSTAVGAGQSLYVVQNLVAHAQPSTTMRYAHVMNKTLRDASQSVADVILKAQADIAAQVEMASS